MNTKEPLIYSSSIPRDLLKQFTTMELMRWTTLVDDYGKELREGSPDSPTTDVFSYSEEGEKRWKDLKNRVVEHVSPGVKCRFFSFGTCCGSLPLALDFNGERELAT